MTDTDRISLENADNLLGEAHYRLRAKNDRDHAVATVTRVYDMVDRIDGPDVELADLYERLYVLFQDLGDDERCEELVKKALALEATLDPARPVFSARVSCFTQCFFTGSAAMARLGGLRPTDSRLMRAASRPAIASLAICGR